MTVKKKLPGAYAFHCLRCDQDFTSNSEWPDQCQRCHSAFWDKPRVMRQRAVQWKAD